MKHQDDTQILTGLQPVLEALKQRRRALYTLHLSRRKDIPVLLDLARALDLPVHRTDPEEITRLVGYGKHQGAALECGPLPVYTLDEILRFTPADGRDTLVALTGVDDPRNLGAVARCCSFLGARALIIPGRGVSPLSPAASRTSSGALESLPVAAAGGIAGICQRLSEAGYEVAGIETGGQDMREWTQPRARVTLVIGSEDRALSPSVRALCDRVLTIPGQDPVGSLNLSVAAGIALYHVMSCRTREDGKWETEDRR